VDYTIKVSSASVAAATSLGDQMKGKIKAVPLADLGAQILKNVAAVSTSGTTYTITVTGVTAEAVVEALVVTNTTSMKPEEKSGSIRVAGSSSFAAGYCSASTVTTSIVTAGTTTDAATTATETSSQVTSTVTTSIVTVGTTGETQQITVFGKMSMVLPNASAFVNDPAAKQGIAKSLANIAGVAVNRVSVDYTIKVSSASVAAATSLGDQMKGKIKAVPLADLGAQILKNVAAVSTSGTTYTITVTGVTAEAVVEALVVTNTTSMKPEEKSGSIRVAGSSSFAAGYCSFFTCVCVCVVFVLNWVAVTAIRLFQVFAYMSHMCRATLTSRAKSPN
ncbi:unnamed protein product, partial [Polarella glacialis]